MSNHVSQYMSQPASPKFSPPMSGHSHVHSTHEVLPAGEQTKRTAGSQTAAFEPIYASAAFPSGSFKKANLDLMHADASLSDHLDEPYPQHVSSRNLLSVEQAPRPPNMTVTQHEQGVIISNEVQVGRLRSAESADRSVSMMAELADYRDAAVGGR